MSGHPNSSESAFQKQIRSSHTVPFDWDPIPMGFTKTTNSKTKIDEATFNNGLEMLTNALTDTGLSEDFITGDYAHAAYSYSVTLNPQPTDTDKKLQEKVIENLNDMSFNGKALLGIGSDLMLKAKTLDNEESRKRFAQQVRNGIVQKQISSKKQKAFIEQNNSGMFKTQNYGSSVTHSRVLVLGD